MKLEEQLTNLKLSQYLQKLGVNQESLFYWVPGTLIYGYEGECSIRDDEKWSLWERLYKPDAGDFDVKWDHSLKDEEKALAKIDKRKKQLIEKVCSAFTVAELGEFLQWQKLMIYGVPNKMLEAVEDNATEADARAQMLIYLIENNLLKL